MISIIFICITIIFCFSIFLISLFKKDVIEFKFKFTLPFKFNIEWKKSISKK